MDNYNQDVPHYNSQPIDAPKMVNSDQSPNDQHQLG